MSDKDVGDSFVGLLLRGREVLFINYSQEGKNCQ